jgi:NADH-quinone oxidoreductase subunit N
MLIAMLSLAGIPFTAGFFGKFLVFQAAVQQRQYLLVAIGCVTVAAGFYYYLKVVRAMYWSEPRNTAAIPVTPVTKVTILALVALIFLLGVYPQSLFSVLRTAPATAQISAR